MLVNELSGRINHIKIHYEITEIMPRKNENVIFQHFLNMDISLPISHKPFKFSACIQPGCREACLKKLRHSSLKKNLYDTHRKFQINNIQSN